MAQLRDLFTTGDLKTVPKALAAVRAQGDVSVAAVRHAAATARMFSFNS